MADSIEITPALYEFWSAVLGDGEFTYDDIKTAGGPSQPTLTKLLKVGESISGASARALEDAVGLERGSIREVAHGGTPRWKPEGRPGQSMPDALNFTNRGESTAFDSIESGYTASGAWAYDCWKVGVPRSLYYSFIDATVELYKAALDARESGSKPDLSPSPLRPVAELSDRRPSLDDLRDEPSAAEPPREDKGDDEDGADNGEHD